MKTNFTLLLFLLLLSAPVHALDFTQSAPLYSHLCEVNAQWQKRAPGKSLLFPVQFLSDRERIQKHLELVEKHLRSNCPATLSPAQFARRMHHLDVLRAYRNSGVFPTNMYHTERVPYFRDDTGVLCAVGFLLWQDGRRETVHRINRENNYGYIFDLAKTYPELEIWAGENGFTLAELAWIQPAYEPPKPNLQPWGNGGGVNPGGRINVMAKNAAENKLFVAGQFTQIDGFAANSIAVWDGSGWSALGDGVAGEVLDLDYYYLNNFTVTVEKLFVAGDFTLPGQSEKCNIAEYDLVNQKWKALQTGDMGGKVYSVAHNFYWLYIGGDFQKVNGASSPFFASGNLTSGMWNGNADKAAVDGPVFDLYNVDELVLAGGDFQQVYPDANGQWAASPYLAYCNYGNSWIPLPNELPSPVRALAYLNGNVYTGHRVEFANAQQTEVVPALNVLKAGLWFLNPAVPFYGDSLVHGFTLVEGEVVAYGGFYAGEFKYGIGAVTFQAGTIPKGTIIADSTVRSVIEFQNSMYLAGDFQSLWWFDSFPGMARIPMAVSTVEGPGSDRIRVIAAPGHFTLRYEALEKPAQIIVYDLAGRPLARQTLPAGDGEVTLEAAANWADGMYVWHLQHESGSRSGKWVVVH